MGIAAAVLVSLGIATAIIVGLRNTGGGDDDDAAGHGGDNAGTLATPTPTPPAVSSAATPIAPSSTATLPVISTPLPLLRVGAQLQVVNTGDCLNVRPEPSRYVKQVTCLTDGTRLSIISGPVVTEGLRWWRVDVPSYRNAHWDGWVAEGPGDGTLWLGPR